ncbi:MAG TPA: SRPBCC family protein [Opitutaceae bacterium]|nr:SRPBCC family protein [Opitutaceae bacterium]
MNVTTPAAAPDSARELRLTRDVSASPEQIFRAWQTRLADWWAPQPFTTPICEVDLRPGGALRTVMRSPDGSEFVCGGVFLEVVPNRRIVFTDAFGPGWKPNPDIFFTAIVTFDPLPEDRTRYTARALHWTAAARQRHEEMGFHQGWGQCLEQLVAVAREL